jgi:adenylosuccinate lyase
MYSISPLDNRYYNKISDLSNYFSYNSWIKYRVYVELEYFSFLYKILPELNNIENAKMMEFSDIKNNINIATILELEKRIHHDIKAIEVYLREQYEQLNIGPTKYKEFIHFGLTSQDINSIAFSLQLKDCINECIIPKIKLIIQQLKSKSELWKDTVILALTHGQPAIPTTLGKEIMVFVERIEYCLDKLKNFKYYTKIGGAVGTLAAHYTTYPEIEWKEELTKFCKQLGLERWNTTTQITNYEDIIELSQILIRINSIFIDFSQDIWLYISNEIFVLNKISSEQVGSSTMPQKVNPINFENAEGNLKLANAGLDFFALKLPISRLQRDLTDSTVLRNYGVYLGHMLLALINIERGVNQLEPNVTQIQKQLDKSPEILGEAIQCLLRKHGIPNGYEIIRNLTQSKKYCSLEQFKTEILENINILNKLDTNDNLRNDIQNLSYEKYLGYFI